MVSCVRLPVCVYETKMWYILKMHFLVLCVKKQQYQSQLKGKICWIWACVWSFRKLLLTPQRHRLLAGFLPGAAWEASRVLQCWHRLSCPRKVALVSVNALVKQSDDHLIGNHSLSSLCQVDKSCFCCCSCGRCCRSTHQFARLKACLKAQLMRSAWVWTATEQNRLLGVHISCSSYKALPLRWVQKRVLWLGSWCGHAVCRAELVPLHGHQPSAGRLVLLTFIYWRSNEISATPNLYWIAS